MDPALKNRLIGASVLIVLAVIFLPMLFDGSSADRAANVQMEIPVPPERDFETRILPLNLPKPDASLQEAVSGTTVPAADTSLGMAPVQVDEPVAQVDSPRAGRVDAVSGTNVDGGQIDAPGAAAPVAAAPPPASTPAATPVVAASARTPDAPIPAAITEPTPVVASAAGRFMVNVGSYANAENAQQLAVALRGQGLSVQTEAIMVDGKSVRRLRLGPYASRALAESARLKAKSFRSDIPASVIEVDDSPRGDAPARAANTARASAFAVQVAVLSDAAKVNAERDRLRAAGFAAFVETLDTDKGKIYRLRIGPESTRDNAEKIRGAVRQRFGFEAIVVDYP